MLSYLQNSKTAIVVVHEIYGINQHITDQCKRLSATGYDVYCPNLLGAGTSFCYDQEALAYGNFMEHVGFHEASKRIKDLLAELRSGYQTLIILGFSVGATIAWLCSREPHLCDVVIGFYGSRIRDYLDLEPQCPVCLLFPSQEKSFSVTDLVQSLQGKNLVWTKTFPGKHGFADPYSKEYNESSAAEAYLEMVTFIERSVRDHSPT